MPASVKALSTAPSPKDSSSGWAHTATTPPTAGSAASTEGDGAARSVTTSAVSQATSVQAGRGLWGTAGTSVAGSAGPARFLPVSPEHGLPFGEFLFVDFAAGEAFGED